MDKKATSKADALKTAAIEAKKLGADEADSTKLDLGAKLERVGAEKGDRITLDKGSVFEYSVDGLSWKEFKPSDEGDVMLSSLTEGLKVDPPELLIRIDRSKIFYARERITAAPLITATVNSVVIDGIINQSIPSPYNPNHPNGDVIITLTTQGDGAFKAMGAGTDVSSWFKNMPAGLNAKIKSVLGGGRKATIVIGGTPRSLFDDAMQIVIPGAAMQPNIAISVKHNPNAIFRLYAIN